MRKKQIEHMSDWRNIGELEHLFLNIKFENQQEIVLFCSLCFRWELKFRSF